MRIPKGLEGPSKKFVTVGKKERFYVDRKDPKAVREMKKQLLLYESPKKLLVAKFFPIISHFIGYEMLNTGASLIYQGRNTKIFDFQKKTVTTLFESDELMAKNLAWMKKLAPRTNIIEIIQKNEKEKMMTTKYRDFELLPLKKFIVHVDKIVEINGKLGATSKKVKINEFLKTLPATKKGIVVRRLKDFKMQDAVIRVCASHGDFHPGNLPRYGTRFYLLDFDSAGTRPKIFDFAYFSFVPSHFNMKYSGTGIKIFKKFRERVEATPAEILVSLSMIRSTDQRLQQFFEDNGMFLET